MDEREVELIDYLRVLWRQKWVIVVTFAAAVAAAYSVSRAIAPTYSTETSLLLLPPLSSELNAEPVGSRLAPEAYQELAVSTSLLQSVMEEVEFPESVSIERLKERFSVSVKRLSSEGELLLTASVRGSDPRRLTEIAAAWTESFTAVYGELFQDRTARSYSYISENYATTEEELEHLLAERRDLLLDHPLDALQAELNALQNEAIANRARLTDARRERDTTIALVAGLEEELAKQSLTHTLYRSMEPDSLVAAGLSGRQIEQLAEIRIEAEELNSTYVHLASQIASNRARLHELEEEIRVREADASRLEEEVDGRQLELTETQARLDNYDRQIELVSSAHSKLASSLQDAKIAVAETPEPIRVIDEPLVPEHPIAPRKKTNIAVAGFLGLMVGTLLAFFVDYLARVHEQERPSRPEGEHDSKPLRGEHTDQDPQAQSTHHREDPPERP